MAVYMVTERSNIPPEQGEIAWQDRVSNLPDVEVLQHFGSRMKVQTGDEIGLRMVCGDRCNIVRA